MNRNDIPVLIVGAGPVGLMGSLLLARHGLESRIIDRRDSPTRAPAAHVVNARTFEICRAAGCDMNAMTEFAADPRDAGHAVWLANLSGEVIGQLPFERQDDEVLRLTPTPLRNLPQHRFEKVLRDTLPKAGAAEVEYGMQWEAAEQDEEGVTSRVRDLASGRTHTIRSRYLIACDGAASPVRKAQGIDMDGPQHIQSFVMIHFAANLRELVKDKPGVLYWFCDPALGPTMVAHDIDREWVYMHPFDPDDEVLADYATERCEALVRAAIASDAFPIGIEAVGTWAMSAQIAERYREGRIFLAGDSAHRFPPTGGLGLNTGVQDVHGLVWRIAAIEAGWARPALLDSYEIERRPVAKANSDNSLRNAMQIMQVGAALGLREEPTLERMHATLASPEGRARVEAAIADQSDHFDTLGLQLGFRYDAGAIVPDGTPPPRLADAVREFEPTGRPGARMPHAWLDGHSHGDGGGGGGDNGERRSTLDLLALDAFSLVTPTSAESVWRSACATRSPIPVRLVVIDLDRMEDPERWLLESGIGRDGALLVRPDQHVGARMHARPSDPNAALRDALERIVSGRIE